MHRYEPNEAIRPMSNLTLKFVLVAAIFASVSAWPAFSAEPIADQAGCMAALNNAEDTIVRANIDSGAFRLLNDQLVEMRTLCGQEDYPGAQSKLLDVMNALKDLEQKS